MIASLTSWAEYQSRIKAIETAPFPTAETVALRKSTSQAPDYCLCRDCRGTGTWGWGWDLEPCLSCGGEGRVQS
jgi:hypothetical protein